jgi:hypothetical protein
MKKDLKSIRIYKLIKAEISKNKMKILMTLKRMNSNINNN